MTNQELILLICRKADQHNIDRAEFLGGAIAESELNPTAWRQGIWPDWSAGLFQQTVLYADEGDQTDSPENVARIKELYFDPEHACDVAAKKYIYWRHDPDVPPLTAWVAYNSPGFYHTPEESPNVENYRRGLREAADIIAALPTEKSTMSNQLVTIEDVRLRAAPTTESNTITTLSKGTIVESPDIRAWRRVHHANIDGWVAADFLIPSTPQIPEPTIPSNQFYNPEFPVSTQEHDWDCAQDSLWWVLHALDRKPDNAWMEDELLKAGIETTEWGLMDASGARIAAWIIEQYQPDITSYNIPDLSYAQASNIAGTTGLLAGARNWYNGGGHWVAIRKFENNIMKLANPGGQFSTHYGEQELDHAAWDEKGPWSGVVVTRKA